MERFCADPVARSVNHPPPSRGRGQLDSWSAGGIGAEAGPLGGSRRGRKPVAIARTVAIISNYDNSYRLFWLQMQQWSALDLCNLTKGGGSRGRWAGLWPSVAVVVAVLRWSAAGPLTVPGLAWSAVAVVAVVADLMQSAGTNRRG